MASQAPAYGLWALVVINVAVFAIFAFSFTHPRSACDWRSFGAFTAFLVALFTEMYGFPLGDQRGCVLDRRVRHRRTV